MRKLLFALFGILAAAAGAITAYIVYIRPWHLRWGANDDELDLELPGDDLVENPKLQATHAVTIQATPAQVWPWLVQLGQGRGGFYSYDWIENSMGLDIHTANQIMPEYQKLEPGDVIPFAQDGFGIPAAIVEPQQALVLHGDTREDDPGEALVLKEGDFMAVSWGFYLFDAPDGATRLVERFRAEWNEAPHNSLFYRVFLEPGSFVMQRKMLLGIKERAEAN